jgi:hypothetical protein
MMVGKRHVVKALRDFKRLPDCRSRSACAVMGQSLGSARLSGS